MGNICHLFAKAIVVNFASRIKGGKFYRYTILNMDVLLPNSSFQQLAEFRYQIRRFLRFSEEAARANGLEPQQHQLLLAIRGLPAGTRPTVRTLAARLWLKHHSTVELIDRLVNRGAVVRAQSNEDRREVLIEITPHGEELLQKLSLLHVEELRTAGRALSQTLQEILENVPADFAPKTIEATVGQVSANGHE